MVEIDNNNRADNDEQRRIERTRENNRKDLERKQAREPGKTFEAKMGEKATREAQLKQNQQRQKQGDRKKKSQDEDDSLIAKLLGAAKEQGVDESQGRVDRLREQSQHSEFEQQAKEDFKTEDSEAHQTKESHESGKSDKTAKSEGGEGHKRIEEQPRQGGGEGGGTGQGSSQGQGGDSGTAFGQGGGRDEKDSKNPENAKMAAKSGAVFAVKQSGMGSQGRFQQQAPAFTRKDLDDIVASVQITVNSGGNEEMTVELENDYYDGLKIQAERTDKGVVLRFICPNTSVRSTFVKYRPQVYEHLKAKGVSVFRIDVV